MFKVAGIKPYTFADIMNHQKRMKSFYSFFFRSQEQEDKYTRWLTKYTMKCYPYLSRHWAQREVSWFILDYWLRIWHKGLQSVEPSQLENQH